MHRQAHVARLFVVTLCHTFFVHFFYFYIFSRRNQNFSRLDSYTPSTPVSTPLAFVWSLLRLCIGSTHRTLPPIPRNPTFSSRLQRRGWRTQVARLYAWLPRLPVAGAHVTPLGGGSPVGGHGDVFSGGSPWTVTGPLLDLPDLLLLRIFLATQLMRLQTPTSFSTS